MATIHFHIPCSNCLMLSVLQSAVLKLSTLGETVTDSLTRYDPH